jgi:hypothetical protein
MRRKIMANNVILPGPIGGPYPPNPLPPIPYPRIPISTVLEYFKDALDSKKDDDIKKVAAAATVIKQKIKNPENPLTPEEITQIADGGISAAKVAYKVGTGELDPTEATDYLIDRSAARLGTVVKTKCEQVGEKAGGVVGAKIGTVFGPVGAAVGAKIGATIGRCAGKFVGKVIIPGIKKVASFAKTVIETAWEGVKSVASTLWEGAKSVLSGIASFLGF